MFFKRLLLPLFFALTGLALSARPALAHDGSPHGAAGWWAAWSLEPAVLVLLMLAAVLYWRGWRVLSARADGVTSRRRWQNWAFVAGMAALAVALISPVDALAGQLFWVHMLQHNLLMLAAAPLLVLAYPVPALLLGLPGGARRGLGKGWRKFGGLRAVWGMISSPPAAWMIQAVLLWAWHMPSLYQRSVENDFIHAIQHFSFLGSALLFWWVVLHTYGAHRANRGAAIIYLFTTAMHSGLLGALLTFSTRLWYPVYAGRAEVWGITALADQQLAGTIMWVPAGTVYLAAAMLVMKAWMDAMEARDAPKEQAPRLLDEEMR